jgi:hypothetical protein
MRCNALERFAGQALPNAALSLSELGWSGSPAASCIERLYRTRRTCLNVYDPDISNVLWHYGFVPVYRAMRSR